MSVAFREHVGYEIIRFVGLTLALLFGVTNLRAQTCANATSFRLPVPEDGQWSVPSNGFGHYLSTYGGYHPGEDWNKNDTQDLGKPVYAVADGQVVKVSDRSPLGWVVAIVHRGSFVIPSGSGSGQSFNGQSFSYGSETVSSVTSIYLHITSIPGAIAYNACVNKGDIVGYIMNPGAGPHLHFEIRHPNAKNSASYTMVFGTTVGDTSNWIGGASSPNGYYFNLQQMVNAGLRSPSDFIAANRNGSGLTSEIASLTTRPQQASWVYYQSNCSTPPYCQWYISNRSGETYLLSGASGYSGEMVWGKIANGNSVATVTYSDKTIYVAPSASTQTSANSYPGVTVYDGRSVNVSSPRGSIAAQEVAGKTMSHAWYFFQVQTTGIWYIVNLNGAATNVMRLQLKPDHSDYDWLLISNSSWKRSFSAAGSSMTITLSEQ